MVPVPDGGIRPRRGVGDALRDGDRRCVHGRARHRSLGRDAAGNECDGEEGSQSAARAKLRRAVHDFTYHRFRGDHLHNHLV